MAKRKRGYGRVGTMESISACVLPRRGKGLCAVHRDLKLSLRQKERHKAGEKQARATSYRST